MRILDGVVYKEGGKRFGEHIIYAPCTEGGGLNECVKALNNYAHENVLF
jgi:hypothetical protein